jgi:tRNA (guanine26-N2/guanine27-N2)-dimethyltransferase
MDLALPPLRKVFEGEVAILVPDEPQPTRSVFYNPRMEVSRDIAVCCLRAYRRLRGGSLSIAEPLTASGVRGIRYAKEVEGVRELLLSDVNPLAVELARRNVELNGLSNVASVERVEASKLLASRSAPSLRLDVVDLDPFGSPAPFIEPALRALRDGGLLMATATDAPPLCGIHPRVAERRYGARSLNVEYCHELAVRLLLSHVASTAARLDIAIHPLLSYALQHHYRICLRVEAGASKADECLNELGTLKHCFSCGHRELAPLTDLSANRCPVCGGRIASTSPVWRGALVDPSFASAVHEELARSSFKHKKLELRLTSTLIEEAEAPPLHFTLDEASRRLKCPQPSLAEVVEELRSAGFKAYRTHFHTKGVKTDAAVQDLLYVVWKLAKQGAR